MTNPRPVLDERRRRPTVLEPDYPDASVYRWQPGSRPWSSATGWPRFLLGKASLATCRGQSDGGWAADQGNALLIILRNLFGARVPQRLDQGSPRESLSPAKVDRIQLNASSLQRSRKRSRSTRNGSIRRYLCRGPYIPFASWDLLPDTAAIVRIRQAAQLKLSHPAEPDSRLYCSTRSIDERLLSLTMNYRRCL